MSFFPGQRWVTNTEPELGLGIIVEVANRRVEISFPAAGEQRTYAVNNAPLNRVIYEIGQSVSDADQNSYEVIDTQEHNGCLIYFVKDAEGKETILPELELNSFVQFSQPQDRLFAGQIDKPRAFELRSQTLENIRRCQTSSVAGLLGPRVQLLPHQLYIANEISVSAAPRALLADEVGLGKTIEAGLIAHRLLHAGRASRVLIVVPDSLVHQWLVEMLRRFNFLFTILDAERCDVLRASGQNNPFESSQLVICALSTLTSDTELLSDAVAASWDLLIVDEAHHLQWSEESVSLEYQTIETLAEHVKGLLLLTATPEQLGVASHFARLRLLDPDRFHSLTEFVAEQDSYQGINQLLERIIADEFAADFKADTVFASQLSSYLSEFEKLELEQTIDSPEGIEAIKPYLIRAVLDRFGPGAMLFRNTRASVAGFPERCLHRYPLAHDGRTLSSLMNPDEEQDKDFLAMAKMTWLIDWLKSHRQEKVLIICSAAGLAKNIEEELRLREGFSTAVFHEGMSLLERDRAAAYFADIEEGAQALICSEIGSEGRNFQFAHHLIFLDLPENPDLLEQRIGRLDRIGQRNTVNIHVPYLEGSDQEVLCRWYHEGLNAFEKTCKVGLAVLTQLDDDLRNVQADVDSDKLDALIDRSQNLRQELELALEGGRDRLVELNSCDDFAAEQLVADMIEEERRQDLIDFMDRIYDWFGVDVEPDTAFSQILRPGDHMLSEHFPGLPDDGIKVTYQRDQALSREDMTFLSWEHPMVTGAMDMVMSGGYGNTSFSTINLPPLKPGSILLEALFVVNVSGPAHLQLQRYLPLQTIRVVMDSDGRDLTKVLSKDKLRKLVKPLHRQAANELTKHLREPVNHIVTRATKQAEQRLPVFIGKAVATMEEELSYQWQRLASLAEYNPNIRPRQIEEIKQSITAIKPFLQEANMRLDAIRIIMVEQPKK